MAGMTRTIVVLVLIVVATAAGYLSIEGWRNAILGAGIAAVLWIVATRILKSLGRFRHPKISLFDRALRAPRSGPGRPADLEGVERLFGWRTYAPDEFNNRIRPFILRLVNRRLMDRRGVDTSTDPERAAVYMGPALRALLLERTEERSDTRRIAELIDEVEAL